MKIKFGTGINIKGRSVDNDFMLSFSSNTQTFGGTVAYSIQKDCNVKTTTLGTSRIDNDIIYYNPTNQVIRLNNLTPDIGTIVFNNTITSDNSGICIIRASCNIGTKEYMVQTTANAATPSTVNFINFAANTLANNITTTFNNLLSGNTANSITLSPLASNYWDATLVKNTRNILADKDLSGLIYGYWVTPDSGNTRGGYIVSPNHFITASHYRPTNIQLLGTDGITYARPVSSYIQIGTTDIAVGYFTQSLPATITPAKVLPNTYLTKLQSLATYPSNPNSLYSYNIPFVYFLHTDRKMHFGIVHQDVFSSDGNQEIHFIPDPNNQSWWYFNGGSSSPAGFFINNQFVLLTCWHLGDTKYGLSYYGPPIHDHIVEINSAMATLYGNTQYQLQTVDLSAFPNI